ncbi:uncharacterized protein LOC119735272 [Patiria miniata]|uniref:Uncharacterized protein n=1 Tax=Patiria miniata TaxID=46514 RepID=A0A914ALL4_PATMI|nr:uncharacterized protein LOC119735272 [Patiria miniata]
MAAGGESVATVLGEISRDHLECGICHERYQTPKILNCLHSFCEKCLLSYQKTLQDLSVMPCPVCRRESNIPSDGVSGLKTNFHLKEIVEDLGLKEKLAQTRGVKFLCELCEDQREAQSRCMDCPFLLCKQCRAGHQRIATTANHEVLALDVLRTGVADLQRKRKVEPLCQKHQGEKKRFFCETCKELICRDCTVVEHRAHQFTTIDDAAPRLRQNVKKLVQKLEHQILPLFQKSETDLHNMNSELVRSASLVEQNVTERASAEETKIEENLRTVREGISSRSNYRSQTLQEHGVTLIESRSMCMSALPKNKNPIVAQEMFSTIDKDLCVLNDSIIKLIKSDQTVRTVIQRFINTTEKEARDGKSKVSTRQKQLLSQIGITSSQKQKFLNESIKVVSTEIGRIRHALEIAKDLVTSASDADFLSLQSIIDSDIRLLLEQSPPKIPSGYQNIAFQGSSDSELGAVVVGATWTSQSDIEPHYTKKTTVHRTKNILADRRSQTIASGWEKYAGERRSQDWPQYNETKEVNITSMAPFGKDEVLVGFEEAVVVYNTSGKRTRDREYNANSGGSVDHLVSFPNESFVGVEAKLPTLTIYCFETKSSKPTRSFKKSYSAGQWTPGSIATTSYGQSMLVIGCKGNNREVMVLDCSNGSVISRQSVQIEPDFLATMGEECVLIGARSPASVQGLKINGNTFQSFLSIDPSVDCSLGPGVWNPYCLGLCSDGTDYIYVVLSVSSAQKRVHVHQYNRVGSFVGCSALETEAPVKGTAVTGDGRLVFADQRKLRLFVMRRK